MQVLLVLATSDQRLPKHHGLLVSRLERHDHMAEVILADELHSGRVPIFTATDLDLVNVRRGREPASREFEVEL